MKKINVTKTFLPPLEEYKKYLEQIWDSGQLTNQGPLLLEFESKIQKYLEVRNFHFVTNGTIALQVALRALEVTEGEVITTPFSYVATTSSILWGGLQPVFVDIDPETLCIDAGKIEGAITPKTKAIMAVHVFGFPCDTKNIESIAKKYELKVIYDSAHAFGVEYKGQSLLSYGDISTCSFHATKLFHTIEGGCVVAPDGEVSEKIEVIKRFGHTGDEHYTLGINAKASELQAAMGLCNLKYVNQLIEERKKLSILYNSLLGDSFQRLSTNKDVKYNYAYYPIIFENEDKLLWAMKELNREGVYPRRYFYPSLNTLVYIEAAQSCPVSEDISKRILCLPLYDGLAEDKIKKICEVLVP